MTMVAAMPVKAVARIVGEHDTRLWRVVHHYVDEARARTNASGVTRLAIDETAARRSRTASLCLSTSTKPASCSLPRATMPPPMAAFADDLTAHGDDPNLILKSASI